jgi:acylphosphatase
MEKVRVHVLISGMVQGVFFRSYAEDKATSLGLTGWVMNTHDGKVEAVFEGEKALVDEMVSWCRKGPSTASIKKVDVKEEKYTGEFNSFYIENSGFRNF